MLAKHTNRNEAKTPTAKAEWGVEVCRPAIIRPPSHAGAQWADKFAAMPLRSRHWRGCGAPTRHDSGGILLRCRDRS